MSGVKRKFWILTGEGIECEREAFRFFTLPAFEAEAEYLPVPALLGGRLRLKDLAKAGDWIFLPGGFSFADHYGSGKLLAFELARIGFLKEALAAGVNLMGVCNGFQVLVETKLFGPDLRLLHNRRDGRGLGFINRWVECRAGGSLADKPLRLSVRHGEGRLAGKWSPETQPFLHYCDAEFSNGSQDDVAGLVTRHHSSKVVGLMPHPEVSARKVDDPDALPTETFPQFRPAFYAPESDGVTLVKALLEDTL